MKRIIQVCSLLSLLVLFTAMSASAQISYGTDVEIPFAFNVGDKAYDAGHYIVKVTKLPNGAATLSVGDTKTDKVQTIVLSDNGGATADNVKLVFETVNGQKHLARIQTPQRTFAVAVPKGSRDGDVKIRRSASGASDSGASTVN
jgi:hypothetical protein